MLHFTILVNNTPIFDTFTAVRIAGNIGERCTYRLGTGSVIEHNYDDGAIALAKLMLDDYVKFIEGVKCSQSSTVPNQDSTNSHSSNVNSER